MAEVTAKKVVSKLIKPKHGGHQLAAPIIGHKISCRWGIISNKATDSEWKKLQTTHTSMLISEALTDHSYQLKRQAHNVRQPAT